MVRVLHLLSPGARGAARRASTLIARGAAPRVTVVGRETSGAFLRSMLDVRRAIRGVDVVHVWDEKAFAVARWAGAGAVVAGGAAVWRRQAHYGAAAWAGRRAAVAWVVETQAQRATLLRHVDAAACHVIEPGATVAPAAADRDALRDRLGLRSDDRVLLAPGPSDRAAGHEAALWATSVLHIIDPRYKLLIPGEGNGVARVRELAVALRQPRMLRVASDAGLNEAAARSAADAALATPAGPAPLLPLIECMAAGLPVVATNHPDLRALLRPGETAALADAGGPPAVARRVLELFEHPGDLARLAAAAHMAAGGQSTAAQFVDRHVALYLRLVDHAKRPGRLPRLPA